jgi:hypothetical protein
LQKKRQPGRANIRVGGEFVIQNEHWHHPFGAFGRLAQSRVVRNAEIPSKPMENRFHGHAAQSRQQRTTATVTARFDPGKIIARDVAAAPAANEPASFGRDLIETHLMGNVIEFLAAHGFQTLAAGLEFLVDLDGLLGHDLVGLRRAAKKREVLTLGDPLMPVGIQPNAEQRGLESLLGLV